jgi:hypothetical protein
MNLVLRQRRPAANGTAQQIRNRRDVQGRPEDGLSPRSILRDNRGHQQESKRRSAARATA